MKAINRLFLLALSLALIFSSVPFNTVEAAEPTEPLISVKLVNTAYVGNKSELTIIPEMAYTTNLPGVSLEAQQTYRLKVNGTNVDLLKGTTRLGSAAIVDLKPVKGNGPLSINGNPYLGSFSFSSESGKYVRPVNTLGLEDYLKGVVPAEMPALWNMEALKSQAVSARTYALGYVNKLPNDTVSYQVYAGYKWHERATQAVEATTGEVITYGGNSIGAGAVFSSSNGGMTESNTNAWGGTQSPYLNVKQDPYDPKTVWNFNMKKQQINLTGLDLNKADSWWASTIEAEQTKVINNIKAWIKANGYAGKDIKLTNISALTLGSKTSGGRVSKGSMTIQFLVKEQGIASVKTIQLTDVSASKIRSIVGLDLMKSYLVDSVVSSTDTFSVSGRGYGHGVGLSQYGARKAGDSGKTYKEILAFYYDGTALKKMYQPAPEIVEPVIPDPAPAVPAPPPVTPAPAPAPAKDETAPAINETKAVFDSKSNKVNVSFKTSETAKLTVKVQDSKGKVLNTLLNGIETQSGVQTASWNVATIANGTYTFVIEASDASGNKGTAALPFKLVKPAPKDITAPIIKNTATSYDAKANKVFLKYEINESAKVTIVVKDSKGKIVATPATNLAVKSGVRWASWDASKLANGTYTITITAVDSSNNKRIATVTNKLAKPAAKKLTGKVTATTLNVRATASSSGKKIGSLKKNQIVTIISKHGSWYKIQYLKGTGYVHSSYVTIVK
ncbi:SpoIID/LytB domain-containing protein [Bacillus sp. FJAT-18017]|uniref:SpoIID/LytB domain-containing protein n=1 Tax=Bacillus sp. FJAT-18017 TaxID=1705566 RepID=UPI0006AFB73C|nr:SpoIID/LytB domain-containing protein [Bacillus sp. FJAT-18017]